ncbi:hypothetical protein O1L60_11640 [Streptomyces diastatochromogenes]|nr:hypothetical protein [Streptomyces diastatochromogenes]
MNRRKTALALLAMASLAACGIQESDVVEAGGAATVAVTPPPEFRMVLYFLGPEGQPVPVVRETGQPLPTRRSPGWPRDGRRAAEDRGLGSGHQAYGQSGTAAFADKAISALLAGPAGADTAAGLTTGLPHPTRPGRRRTPRPSEARTRRAAGPSGSGRRSPSGTCRTRPSSNWSARPRTRRTTGAWSTWSSSDPTARSRRPAATPRRHPGPAGPRGRRTLLVRIRPYAGPRAPRP